MTTAQSIPKLQQTFRISDLGDALTIGRIVLLPERSESKVAVLPIDVDALLVDKIRDGIDHVLAGYRIAEVKHPKLDQWPFSISLKMSCDFSNEPVGVLNRQRRSDNRAFRLKPQQELHAMRMGSIADRS